MGMGTVELNASPGPTKSLVANMERWMGDLFAEVVDEDPFPRQNRHLAMNLEG